MNLLGMFSIFKKSTNIKLNVIIIGYTTYYILETKTKDVLVDKLISKLFNLAIPLYWVANYYEFETLFTYFQTTSKNVFILIY